VSRVCIERNFITLGSEGREGVRYLVNNQGFWLNLVQSYLRPNWTGRWTRVLSEHGCPPGLVSVLQIEIKPPAVTHGVAVRKVHDWVNGACKSPK
jgi:hypothetical protein